MGVLILLAGCSIRTADPAPLPVVADPPAEATAFPTSTALPLNTPPPPHTPDAGTARPIPTATPLALADAPSSVTYILPLVTQHVTDTSAVLSFELDKPASGFLLYWPADDPAAQQQVVLFPGETHQQVTLVGLTPGTAYQAVLALGPEPDTGLFRQVTYLAQLWDPVSFRTASDHEPLRVGVLGDSGFGSQTTFDLANRMAEHNLDFVIHTGDVVYLMEEEANPYESYALKWFAPLQPLLRTMPVYPVVGNHDILAVTQYEGMPFYYRVFPPFSDPRFLPSDLAGRNQWYAFAYGDIQFLMLDTQTFFGEAGRFEQELWMAERLADVRFAHTIVVFHVPPFTSGVHISDGQAVQSWVSSFEASNVRLVLAGHDHNYQRSVVGSITYVVSGGGSEVLYNETEPVPGSMAFARRSHFVLLEIYANQVELQAIALDGEVLDRATITLP